MSNLNGWDRILAYLREVRKESFVNYAYPINREEGIILYSITFLLATKFGELNILEAGSGVGYSTLWFLLAVRHWGKGTVYAIEKCKDKAQILENNVKDLGLNKYLKIYVDDAIKIINRLSEDIHIAFIDIEKNRYIEAFEKLKEKIVPGGVILAHNAWIVRDYLKHVLSKKAWSTIVVPSNEGIVLSVKL